MGFSPLRVALRSRSASAVLLWIMGVAGATFLIGDRSFLFRVVSGVEPRPVFASEVIVVVAVVCLPAVTAPQLWEWERLRARVTVRAVAASLAPLSVLLAASMHQLLARLDDRLEPSHPGTTLLNGTVFGCLSVVVVALLGRRAGPLVALGVYSIGIVAQAMTFAVPLPFRSGDHDQFAVVVSVGLLGAAAVLLARTLGRTQRTG
ncbi:hypothetical protein [Pimelobacter simplex]|uniref:hypothetical protein n=1 Tax=Nocardioides simplex TaxID=2045 RepID=UPI003AB0FC93